MLVPELIVILALSMSLVWFLRYYLKVRSAIQWWSQKRSHQLATEAQQIRDGLLQQSFSLRRSLELSLAENPQLSAQKQQNWLEEMEKLHQSLVQLSDRLAPPYLEESLPLAIEQLLYQKKTEYNQLRYQWEMPENWTPEVPTYNWLILNTLDELISFICQQISAETLLQLTLKQQGERRELEVRINYQDPALLASICDAREWQHLSRLFSLLTSGHCVYSCRKRTMIWRVCWQSNEKFKVQQ